MLSLATGPSSHVTFSVRRASLASHQLSATIATPEARELLPWPAASTMNACLTPGSFLTSSRLALTALPPKTGHFSNDRVERAFGRLVDAEARLAGHDVEVVDAADPLADDLEVARVLERGLDRGPVTAQAARARATPATRRSPCGWTPRASRCRRPSSAR